MNDDRLAIIERKLDEQRDMIAEVQKDMAVVKSNQDRDRDANHKEHVEMREFIVDKNRVQDRNIKGNSDKMTVFEVALHEIQEEFNTLKLFIENTKGKVQGLSLPLKRMWELLLAVVGGGAVLKLFDWLLKIGG